jgi:hydrogenase maturation protein HypF
VNNENNFARARLTIRGAVQGVGFRPFVFRLATELGLSGWVNNSSQGVFAELEGDHSQVQKFILRIEAEKPPRSFIQSLESSWLDPVGYHGFEIRASDPGGAKTALVLPDIATCSDCVQEIFDPNNRRYRYPFTNCTNCGPRFSIIEALPYDRANTSMRKFTMCERCRAEYEDPRDRRFHAQPNACPVCGPQVELWDQTGRASSLGYDAMVSAVAAIRGGAIVAIKGLGGFHLVVDARNEEAVQRLRQRKHREEKPLALMFHSLGLLQTVCEVSAIEARLLSSAEAPIVLLRRGARTIDGSIIGRSVAPHNPYFGAMLPYTPLHHLLLAELGFPVVATSGNRSDEPICTDEYEAVERLGDIADLFLMHNRPIVRQVDDSVARVVAGRELMLRRARGYAPLPIQLKGPSPPILAVGGHLKNSVAVTVDRQVFVSQHIGDLATAPALIAFRQVISDFERLYGVQPSVIAADLHPDYLSTRFARESGVPIVGVQHHLAHIFSGMAENELVPPVLGVAWDGTGYGVDGTIWGGEFLKITQSGFERSAFFRTFGLPGGEAAIKEPRRSALGLLYEVFGDSVFGMTNLAPVRAFSGSELAILQTMLKQKLNLPSASSVGRLFDAVASLIGLRQVAGFEGQAAMELEFALDGVEIDAVYPMRFVDPIIDWEPLIRAMIKEIRDGVANGEIAAKVHNTVVEMIVTIAHRAGESRVVLSGGCFQNQYLTERTVRRLREEGFAPYWHQRVPPNDGGISLGQAVAAMRPNYALPNAGLLAQRSDPEETRTTELRLQRNLVQNPCV